MLLPVFTFMIFTLAPTLLLILFTSLELWDQISFSAYLDKENPSQLLYLLDNLPGKENDLLSTGENMVHTLTCSNVKYVLPTDLSASQQVEMVSLPHCVEVEDILPILTCL
ncbi:hypothetical protein DSO57_1011414 [Entomophthora muscae]|uniref:Uncharacterized protein n=1 Tax=Entomophthora muscae TaxID=34485 RepID=A0ACC2UR30_9FUNG|nr:hypothetical protein DSO57_1011414 [Entomophthora muscae]